MPLPAITVLSLGGTISSTQIGGPGFEPTLPADALVSELTGLEKEAKVSAYSFRQVASDELTLDDLVELSREVECHVDEGASGVVITQGTDTIEETAFTLDLLVDREAPIVVTGAMRSPDLPGADGPANLSTSIRVAASEVARGLGTLVVLNDEIHAARFVKKTHTQNPAAFRSPLSGPVGLISEGIPRVIMHPAGKHKIDLPVNTSIRPVALYTVSLGDDGRLLGEIGNLGYEGLVVEALGGGQVPSWMVETLASLAGRMPVVLASRTGSGEILQQTYGFPGSETDLLKHGLIPASTLDGPKARLLLALLLYSGVGRDEISRTFHRWLDS